MLELFIVTSFVPWNPCHPTPIQHDIPLIFRLAKLKDYECRGLGDLEEDVRTRYLHKLNSASSFVVGKLDGVFEQRAFDGENGKGKKRARALDIEGKFHTGMEEHN